MGREYAISNRALEEYLERLLRWGELCAQLRELYYKYLDLAAFKSEKCYFPGRKCRRPWGREYDAGDLTLMWMHILNTAPFCGKLTRALAEVEYKIRKRALESFRKYGGTESRSCPSGRANNVVVTFYLEEQVHAYLALWGGKLYVIWGEFEDLPGRPQSKVKEIERRIANIIMRRERNGDIEVEEYSIDDEYKRLWLEVPLPKQFGGRAVPVALLRNLGWILSDDVRYDQVRHEAGNPGQAVLRLLDWIALATYAAKKFGTDAPLVFRLSVYKVTKTKSGENPAISVQPIGTATRLIKDMYAQLGIRLGNPEAVLQRGYYIIGELNKAAIRRYTKWNAVDDVESWIALSAVLTTLIIGDGTIIASEIQISTKDASQNGKASKVAGLLNTSRNKWKIALRTRFMRLMIPGPPVPAFEKTAKLYRALLEYPVAALLKIGEASYLLHNDGNGKFRISGKGAHALYEALKDTKVKMRYKDGVLSMYMMSLKALAKLGFEVRFLNHLEKNEIKEVDPFPSLPSREEVISTFEEVAKVARFLLGRNRNSTCVIIIPNEDSEFERLLDLFKRRGLRVSVWRKRRAFVVYERTLVNMILTLLPHLFSRYAHTTLPPPLYISFVKAAPAP